MTFPIELPGPFPTPCNHTSSPGGHRGWQAYGMPMPCLVRDIVPVVTDDTAAMLHWLEHSDPLDTSPGSCSVTLDGPVYETTVGFLHLLGAAVRDLLALSASSTTIVDPLGGDSASPRAVLTTTTGDSALTIELQERPSHATLGTYVLDRAYARGFGVALLEL